ncbi:hypothetical protein [Antarcticirhabdus aurantiaca]|uniref:Uncharacterized protein n=1 Tax=Antarcticirhabdus aurantiaca TaxID=2606717 RepID=A0ACD4NPH0_9HYPH|nr:hypothetical protein [Antarcticirhabdus aurantiaca]WAJ28840.1 hypothetical protein OXU80_00890 [Jeongeuplla avenae]
MHPPFARVRRRLDDVREAFDRLQAIEAEIVPLLAATPGEAAGVARNMLRGSGIEGIYSGIEGVLKALLVAADGEVHAEGGAWHARLLAQAAEPTGRRPPIISQAVFDRLDRLRAFRHVERNTYAHLLRAGDVERNVQILVEAFPAFEVEILDFLSSFDPADA